MKKFALILLGLLLLPVSGQAQTTVDNAFEERVVRVLQERLNLQSTRDALDAGSSDLSVRTLIEGNPQVALLGNARVVGNRDDGTPSQLAFSVVLVPDSPSLAQREQILEFANRWNGQLLPLKVIAQPNTVAMVTSRLVDLNHGIVDDEIVGMYVFIMQTWQNVLADLRANAILQ